MNRILLLAIAASSGAAATAVAVATSEASSSSSTSSLSVEAREVQLTTSPTPTASTAATAINSKTAKNQKMETDEHGASSSTAPIDIDALAATAHPISENNGNHTQQNNSHHNYSHPDQHIVIHQRPGTGTGGGGGDRGGRHDLFGKSAKSGSKGSKNSKTNKEPAADDDGDDEGTTWAPGSIPSSMVSATSLSPSTSSSPTSSLHPTTMTTTSQLPALTWMGVNGCTPTNPCDACTGDCDSDSDCLQIINMGDNNNDNSSTNLDFPVLEVISLQQQQQQRQRPQKSMTTMACFKRADGSTDQVPGCQMGGEGDIPGADYCYYKLPVVDDCDRSNVPTYLPTAANSVPATTAASPAPTVKSTVISTITKSPMLTSSYPPAAGGILTMAPSATNSKSTSTTLSPAGSPSFEKTSWPSSSGIVEEEKVVAYFIQSKAVVVGGVGRTTTASTASGAIRTATTKYSSFEIVMDDATLNAPRNKRRNLQEGSDAVVYWCASGALSPNYYQLLLEECAYENQSGNDAFSGNNVIARMEQMDQLWSMDSEGYIHSVWDYERCMTVPIYAVDNVDEVPVKIGPCDHDASALSQFYYDNQTLKLVGFNRLCVTFEGGGVATKGSPMILGACQENEDKFGWDFVLKQDEGEVIQQPSSAPAEATPSPVASDLPRLQYLGRGGCGGESTVPCQSCAGDCDVDDDCSSGLLCFQRAIGDSSQVPGCALGGPGDIPGADYCFDPTYIDGNSEAALPSLRWRGAEGCTAESPCPACKGDCDEDEDCQGLYKCLKRLVGETTRIPGCAVGGSGDIPGGDYCYDPNIPNDGKIGIEFDLPTHINGPPTLSTQPTSLKPTETTISFPSFGDDSSAPSSSTANAPLYPTPQLMPISSPPLSSPELVMSQLQYLGRNACSTSVPCQSCAGDCDSDDDCSGELLCFQRVVGDSSQVPGCEVGGLGDIPGGDYCFDPTYVNVIPGLSSTTVAPSPSSAGVSSLLPLRWLGTEGCTPNRPCLACIGECDDDDDCDGPFLCFRRLLGETTQVPGCAVGGLDDIPGGDYCYDPSRGSLPPSEHIVPLASFSGQLETALSPTIYRGEEFRPTAKSELTTLNSVPSSTPTAVLQLGLPTVGNSSSILTPSIPEITEIAEKKSKSKSTKDRIKDSQMKGKHSGPGYSSAAVIERRRKHETTRKEREHLNANQK